LADDGGLARFQRRMRAIPKAARDAVGPTLEKAAKTVTTNQKMLAPRDDGTLRNSIKSAEGPSGLTRTIMAGGAATTRPVRSGSGAGVMYDYALAQEYGTKEMPANSFFWPGYRMVRAKVKASIKRAIGKAIREAK
jgi:HK97 gp10 family phage protein